MIGRITILAVGIAVLCVLTATLYDEAPKIGDDTTDVIFMMGQSNATYRDWAARPAQASPVPEPGTAFYYGTSSRPSGINQTAEESGIWPMSYDGGATIGDKWPAIAATYTEHTGRNVLMAELGEGNQSIRLFNPTMGGRLWNYSVERVADVMQAMENAGMTPGVVRIVWIQGENDVLMNPDEYAKRLIDIGDSILGGELGCKVTAPIWISETRGTNDRNGSGEAQVMVCQEHPDMFRMASTLALTFSISDGTLAGDGIHYSQKGNNLLGSEIGNAIGEQAQSDNRMSTAIWGIIGIGVFVLILIACVAIFRR